ncbi:MAG TPA: GTP cyclohydrolase I FolE [Dehalococcoidia bacterium]|jgi:GTP cyclohydrolase I|nr:GTP cyclohydrolase I FolE [Chloroflexota bacterium]MDP5877311.1 GTP cyclohydrolase I FolE [Dehalococcoidia bacterium]MDP6272734.1 GTP cyclohydrolase I FolE [Dehalococcoidia bacterium]MDP7159972.1 GTP cyclohydrolase I FolE [Dehalococcoidia bacterium]MDP7212412.1 GTP cyclohydrolase I FolE [Dehalococcoidia bacterium]|tara:strand:- start:6395 stop:7048 length:654 start_codon:yes stop_codon:yes gene_type:complete
MIEERPTTARGGLKQLTFEDGLVLSAECKEVVAEAISTILDAIGQDPARDDIASTPLRVARMYDELLSGYMTDQVELLNDALFDVEYDEMVVVKDIDFYSMCEHHMLPFYGHASVGYLPNDKVIGLSKIPRLVDMFARRLQVQERMTQQIATFLEELIKPRGVAVVVEASHLCAAMRGVKKQRTRMVTSAMLGAFRDNPSTRGEFMMHIGASSDPLL